MPFLISQTTFSSRGKYLQNPSRQRSTSFLYSLLCMYQEHAAAKMVARLSSACGAPAPVPWHYLSCQKWHAISTDMDVVPPVITVNFASKYLEIVYISSSLLDVCSICELTVYTYVGLVQGHTVSILFIFPSFLMDKTFWLLLRMVSSYGTETYVCVVWWAAKVLPSFPLKPGNKIPY